MVCRCEDVRNHKPIVHVQLCRDPTGSQRSVCPRNFPGKRRNPGAQCIVLYIVNPSDKKRGMSPRAVGQPANNIADSSPALDQYDIAGC